MRKSLKRTNENAKKATNFNVKSESGITMFVLVVTIIMMIMLAAVSVRIAVGNGNNVGVIQSTSEQKTEQVKTVENETAKMNEMIQEDDLKDWGY